jgi:hypothetical protein
LLQHRRNPDLAKQTWQQILKLHPAWIQQNGCIRYNDHLLPRCAENNIRERLPERSEFLLEGSYGVGANAALAQGFLEGEKIHSGHGGSCGFAQTTPSMHRARQLQTKLILRPTTRSWFIR